MSSSATGSTKYRTYRDPDTEARLEVEALRAILPDKIDAVMASFRHDRLHVAPSVPVVPASEIASVEDERVMAPMPQEASQPNGIAQPIPPRSATNDTNSGKWPTRLFWGGLSVMLWAGLSLSFSYWKGRQLPEEVPKAQVQAPASSTVQPSLPNSTETGLQASSKLSEVRKAGQAEKASKKPQTPTRKNKPNKVPAKVERFSEDITPLLREGK